MNKRNKTWLHAGFALLSALSVASCTKKRTAIVLWMNSDIPRAAWDTVKITATGTGAGAPVEYYASQEFRPNAGGMELPIPGSLQLLQERGESSVEVTVEVALREGNGTAFQVKAKARFNAEQWRQLTVFLPYQCSDEAIRRQCSERSAREGVEYTCGAAGADPCVLVTRNDLQVFEPDSGVPSLPDASAPSMDATVEAGMDASAPDSMPDSAPDTAPDSMPDVVQMVGMPHAPVAPVWPRSGAYFTGVRPTVSVRLPNECAGATGLELVLCPSLAPTGDTCAGGIRIMDSTVTSCSGQLRSVSIPEASAPRTNGAWSWAARMVTDTPMLLRRGPLSFRAMSLHANTAMNGQTSILGVVPDMDGDGRGDLITASAPFYTFTPVPAAYAPMTVVMAAAAAMTTPTLTTLTPFPPVGAGGMGSFGTHMLTLGDAELDGTNDVLFTDPFDAMNGSTGYRYVSTATLAPRATQPTIPLIAPPQPGFGAGAASADFNRDGFVDLIVSSPNVSVPGPQVIYGSATGFSATATTLPPPGGALSFGSVIAAGCDINGDGFPDAVISGSEGFGTGSVAIYFGGMTGLSTTPAFSISQVAVDALPLSPGAGIGASLACNGDFNKDGFADIAIGALDGESNLRGGVLVLGGGTSGSPITRVLHSDRGSMTENTNFGSEVEFVGHVVGGDPTLAVGTPHLNRSIGGVTLLVSRSGSVATQNIASSDLATVGQFGYRLRYLGPIGPMGEDGFVVGVPFAGGDQSGRVELFRANASNAIPYVAFNIPAPGSLMGTRYGGNFAR
jgi:hypothetical protein